MITKELVKELVEAYLQNGDYKLQKLEIDKEMNILVEIDRLGVVDVEFCAALNRYLVEQLGDKDDYSLEVGSVSITAPFISKIQYQKNLGRPVEVLADGKKYRGELVSVDEETFAIDTEVMMAEEGKKRKQKHVVTMTFPYEGVTYTKYDLKF
ncbi:MAG: ribosome assembly cofactor RimP [Paludibacteraceae bacterium]|nr:ribosome assembly cofactor RimP [Paludibacteraceae bacterium]